MANENGHYAAERPATSIGVKIAWNFSRSSNHVVLPMRLVSRKTAGDVIRRVRLGRVSPVAISAAAADVSALFSTLSSTHRVTRGTSWSSKPSWLLRSSLY